MLKATTAAMLVSLASLAVSAAANAGACTTALMSVYDATGFSCTFGNMTFSNFS